METEPFPKGVWSNSQLYDVTLKPTPCKFTL